MNTELRSRIQFHKEQANRLLSEHPLVREFNYHYQQITLFSQQVAEAEAAQAEQTAAKPAKAPRKR